MGFLRTLADRTILTSLNVIGLRSVAGELLFPSTPPSAGDTLIAGAPTGDVSQLSWQANGPTGATLGHTGLIAGGVLSVNGTDPETFDISAGSGWIVDHSDPENPAATLVSWGAQTGLAVTDLATSTSTSVGVSLSAGSPVFTQFPNNIITPLQRRNSIVLGGFAHPDHGDLSGFSSAPGSVAYDGALPFLDFVRTVTGPANVGPGNDYAWNGAGLQIMKSAGQSFSPGVSFHTEPQVPHLSSDPSLSTVTMLRVYRDGSDPQLLQADGAPTTNVNPAQWDNGSGTLQSVPVASWTVQEIFWIPGADLTLVAYGQELFTSSSDALEALRSGTLAFEERPQQLQALKRASLVVRGNMTDLSSAIFVDAPAFRIRGVSGSIASGSGASTFIDLTDTPSTFTGQAGKVVKVNVGESALEFSSPSALQFDSGLLVGTDQAIDFGSSDYPLITSSTETYGLPNSVSGTEGAVMMSAGPVGPGGVSALKTIDNLAFRELTAGVDTLLAYSNGANEARILLRTGTTERFEVITASGVVKMGRAGTGSGLAFRNNSNETLWPTGAGSVGQVLGLSSAGQLSFVDPSATYGSQYQLASSASETIATTTYTALGSVAITVGTVPAGTYMLEWSCTVRRTAGGQGHKFRVHDGTAALWETIKETQDTNDRLTITGRVPVTNPSSKTFTLQGATYAAGTTLVYDNISLEISRRS